MERHNRLGQFDALRAWAIVGVVVIHASAPFIVEMYKTGLDSTPVFWVLAMNQAGRFSVPAFFLLAGFFTAYGKHDFERSSGVVAYVCRREVRILLPYVVWSFLIYILPEIALGRFGIQTILPNLILGWTFNGAYFLVVLAQLTILGPILVRFRGSGNRLLKGSVLFSLIISESVFYFGIYGQTYLSYLVRVGFTPFLSTFVPWAFFYVLGLSYGLDYEGWNQRIRPFRKWFVLSIPIALAFSLLELDQVLINTRSLGIAVGFFKLSTIILALCACGYILGTRVDGNRAHPLISLLADNSFAIYLIHGGVIQALSSLSFFTQHLLAGQTVLISVGLLVPIAIYQFSRRQLPSWAQIVVFGSAHTDDSQTFDKNVAPT